MAVIITNMDMPKSCGGCPCVIYTAEEKKAIGYCNTSNEDYYCKALDRFMEYDKVDGGLDILGKPSDCPLKEVPSGKKQAILDELAKESDMLISTAYLYAKAFVSYGVDVTQAWTTAVQQTANLEQAHKRGYYEALKMVEEQTGENK